MLDQLLDTTTGTDTCTAGQNISHALTGINVTVTIIHMELIPDHITDATIGAPYDTITPVLIAITVTHHTGDHPHIEVYQLISRDHSRSRSCTSYKPSKNNSFKPSSSSSRTTVKPQDKKHRRVMIDDPQSDYYSSDDTSSDFENYLN